eukprot:11545244-Ditylum_brightwellii.AAC.1
MAFHANENGGMHAKGKSCPLQKRKEVANIYLQLKDQAVAGSRRSPSVNIPVQTLMKDTKVAKDFAFEIKCLFRRQSKRLKTEDTEDDYNDKKKKEMPQQRANQPNEK